MTEAFLDVGLPLCLCSWGDASAGPPVLVLHGFLEQGAAWDAVAGPLSTQLGRQVVAPDHRGHGRSGHVGASQHYHFWDYVGDVQAVVDHLGGVVDLVGHSMGGTMAVLFAGSRPECVRRLVLVEGLGPPDLEGRAVVLGQQFLDSRRRPPHHPHLRDVHEAAARMQRFNPSLSEDEAHRLAARVTRPTPDGVSWSWDARHRSRNPVPFQERLFLRFLRAIGSPVLLVDGADSSYARATPPSRPAALGSPEHVRIAGAGHLVHHDQPKALADVIGGFLESTDGARL